MDPLSITAATIGISTAACASIATLRNTISGLGEAQEELHSIRFQLDNIEKPLRILDSFAVDETALVGAQRILAKTTISHTVNNCGKACEAFDKKLKRWTRHSQDVKLSLRDKMSVGVWNVEKIRTFKFRVETCGQIVQLAVSSTQLLLQEKSMQRSEAGYQALSRQMEALELQAREQVQLIKQQRDEALLRGNKLELRAGEDSDDDAELAQAAGEAKKQSRLLEETQVSMAAVFVQLRATRTHQEIGNVFTDQESMALVGLPERLVGKVDQSIGDVSTTGKSASMVGVFDKTVDLKDFFRR